MPLFPFQPYNQARLNTENNRNVLTKIDKLIRILSIMKTNLHRSGEITPNPPPIALYTSEESEKSELNPLISLSSHLSPEPHAPKLLKQALHGPIGDIVDKVAPLTEAHPAPILLEIIIGVGNIIGNKPFTMAQCTKHHTNLFGVVVGDSSTGRKGTAWGVSKSILGQRYSNK